jgi:predicted lactoylglutathione lyase
MKEDHIYAMFLKEEFFQTFTDRPIAKGDTTQTLLAIGVNSREEVDGMVKTAIENGGSKIQRAARSRLDVSECFFRFEWSSVGGNVCRYV